jgi:hypothetical protein
MLFIRNTDIYTFYNRRKGRTRGGKMVSWNNRERTLSEGHRAPRDTSMSFWSKSSTLISEQNEKNSSACSWNECYDASQITCHITWYTQHPPHCAKKDGLVHSNKCIRRKIPKITPPHYEFLTYSCHIFSLQPKYSPQYRKETQGTRSNCAVNWLYCGPSQV